MRSYRVISYRLPTRSLMAHFMWLMMQKVHNKAASHCCRLISAYRCLFTLSPRSFHSRSCIVLPSSYFGTVFTTTKKLHTLLSREDSASDVKSFDPNVILYYRPAASLFNVNLPQASRQSVNNICIANDVLHIGIHNIVESAADSLHAKKNKCSGNCDHIGVKSIDDVLCREVHSYLDYSFLPTLYAGLSKVRLTGLVVVTTMAGYALAPGSFDFASFLFCCFGTGLISASANAVNQLFEVPFDSQMNRTRTRPLVKGLLSPLHAFGFAAFTGVTGTAMLSCGINDLTAVLGALNLILYTAFYTPMKRSSIANTWLGSLVGAIPPLMGWAASTGTLHIGAVLLGAIMYSWQFPHFCALSWNLRPDYSRAGYRMMSVINPALCQRTALRYSLILGSLCALLPYFGVTTWTFAIDSLPLNMCLIWLAWRFYHHGTSHSSRQLFRFSLIHIPALLILMLISKKQFGIAQIEDIAGNY